MKTSHDDHVAEQIDPAEPPVGAAPQKPLTADERARLVELRRPGRSSLNEAEKKELAALVAREDIPEPPLSDAERERLNALSEPKKLSDAEAAELDALSRRSAVPSPVVVHEDHAEMHGVLDAILSLVGSLAAQVPTAHNLASQVQDLRGRLVRAMAARK